MAPCPLPCSLLPGSPRVLAGLTSSRWDGLECRAEVCKPLRHVLRGWVGACDGLYMKPRFGARARSPATSTRSPFTVGRSTRRSSASTTSWPSCLSRIPACLWAAAPSRCSDGGGAGKADGSLGAGPRSGPGLGARAGLMVSPHPSDCAAISSRESHAPGPRVPPQLAAAKASMCNVGHVLAPTIATDTMQMCHILESTRMPTGEQPCPCARDDSSWKIRS